MKKVPCEIYTRVVGYYRPIQKWNAGKYAEYQDRKEFAEESSLNSPVLRQRIKQAVDEAKPKYITNGVPNRVYVGVRMCEACEEIEEKIQSGEVKNAAIVKFDKLKETIPFCNAIQENTVFPFRISTVEPEVIDEILGGKNVDGITISAA